METNMDLIEKLNQGVDAIVFDQEGFSVCIMGKSCLDRIVYALGKQTPKETKHTHFGTECSVCGSLVTIRGCARLDYCPWCGQKIDWTKEDLSTNYPVAYDNSL